MVDFLNENKISLVFNIDYMLIERETNYPLTDIMHYQTTHTVNKNISQNELKKLLFKKFGDQLDSQVLEQPGGSFLVMRKDEIDIKFIELSYEGFN